MINPQQYKNTAYASSASADKIVGILTGSYNSATQTTTLAGYLYQFSIPHSFTRPVFTELLWSIDGTNYVDGGSGKLSGTFGLAYADSSNVYVTTGLSTGTIFYKVICTWIDNYDATNPSITPVLNTTSGAYFDSRQNYQKIIDQDITTGTTGTIVNIAHNLGYSPNAKVFFESFSGQVWPQIDGGTNDFWLYDFTNQAELHAVTDTVNLQITYSVAPTSRRAWYRIFGDQ